MEHHKFLAIHSVEKFYYFPDIFLTYLHFLDAHQHLTHLNQKIQAMSCQTTTTTSTTWTKRTTARRITNIVTLTTSAWCWLTPATTPLWVGLLVASYYGTIWDKSGSFRDQISVHFCSVSLYVLKSYFKKDPLSALFWYPCCKKSVEKEIEMWRKSLLL